MPFNSITAAESGKKGGKKGGGMRWYGKDEATKRSETFLIKVTAEERDAITEKAKRLGLSRVEFVVRAAAAYKEN